MAPRPNRDRVRRVVLVNFEPHIIVVTDKNVSLQQPSLFPAGSVSDPSGFRYEARFLSADEEKTLVRWIETLPLKPFEFRGYLGNRRVMSFGFRYDYTRRAVDTASPVPDQLAFMIARAGLWSGHESRDIRQVMVTEYAPGAPIGWHADKPQFGDVLGISLLAPARFRLRRLTKSGWERRTIDLEPRSIYLMSGEVRKNWQHSIPPMTELRYSITLRTFDEDFARQLGEQQTAA
jgi:alkylated DNA repair dioxygenase AlkB